MDAKTLASLQKRQKEILLDVLNSYRANGRFPDGMTPVTEIICCDSLAACGLMEKIEVTPDEQREIWQRTMNHYARIGNIGDLERLRKAGHDADELQAKAFTLARRNALKRALERIIENDIEIAL